MRTFRVRTFLVIVGFAIFTLIYVSVGIRWHIYRARASYHARQEVEHTFEAFSLIRASRVVGSSPEAQTRAANYRKLAEGHEKLARECARLRIFYENCW